MWSGTKAVFIICNFIFFTTLVEYCQGQEQQGEIIRIHKLFKYTGYIFPNDSVHVIPGIYTSQRFTPSNEDIIRTERIISQHRKSNNEFKKVVGQLCKYKRQYAGYVSDHGEKIVWVNSLCGKEFNQRIKKEIVVVLGGGACYWNLKINLQTGEIFDLVINNTS